MNGPEHYREAERMLKLADESRDLLGMTVVHQSYLTHRAQVHATLALAAATASPIVKDWLGDEDRSGSDWMRVTK